MGTRKRTSELVFNLQWRNKPDNGGDKSNVIGMYDTPTTTSNFEMFKSYLLKNSGVAGNDVKVTYLTDDGQEWIIDSQEWFEIALSAFRLKARLGEIIYLKLNKISSARHHLTRKHSNDVETQFDLDSMDNSVVAPPEWFVTYMNQFKRDIVNEVTNTVASNISATNVKDKESVPQVLFGKKAKPDSSKRARKHQALGETPIDKELLKTLKFDRKLDCKLDKLDAKTKKIKEKKQALMHKIESDEYRCMGKYSVDSDETSTSVRNALDKKLVVNDSRPLWTNKIEEVAPSTKDTVVVLDSDDTPVLNATLIGSPKPAEFVRMVGGEIYLHSWEVVNSGKQAWSSNTELRLTWGSAKLIPSVKSIQCPPLHPGENGTIMVRFEIPRKPGTYESYWNFYDNNIRFGHSLSCFIIVEKPLASIISDESVDQLKTNKKTINRPVETPTKIVCALDEKQEEKPVLALLKETQTEQAPPKTEEKNADIGKIIIFPSQQDRLKKSISAKKMFFIPSELEENKPLEKTLPRISKYVNTEYENVSDYPDLSPLKEGWNPYNIISPANPEKVQSGENVANVKIPSPETETMNQMIGIEETNVSPKDQDMKAEYNVIFCTGSVMDLSRRIQEIKINGSSQVDSDSDWESLVIDSDKRKSNKYGINEKDLIVDLSKSAMKNSVPLKNEVEDSEQKVQVNVETDTNEDNNNNNGTLDNNNSSESISEIASEASSDLSSGYDVLNVPICAEKEESSGYVYITIDGNKLPVPKYILRPDFLINAEEAPGPLTFDEEGSSADVPPKETVANDTVVAEGIQSQIPDTNQNIQEQIAMSHCSAAGSCFSDATSGRLFIFPQNHPGFEVVSSAQPEIKNEASETTSTPVINQESTQNGSSPTYSWAKSQSQYSVSQVPNAAQLRNDPYGPLDHSQSASGGFSNASSTPTPNYRPTTPNQSPAQSTQHPGHSYSRLDEAAWNQFMPHCHYPQEFQHIPNYQQSPSKPDSPPVSQQQGPSAPPQQNQSPPGHGMPVHILPENLVSGAVNVASSAINTARSVINMIVPPKTEPGKWVNGHWVTENTESLRAKNLCILAEMGFWDADLNASLLARYNDDIARVVSDLIQ